MVEGGLGEPPLTSIIKKQPITVPEVNKILSNLNPEKLDQLQKRTLDYASEFSKIPTEAAHRLKEQLMRKAGLGEEEAVEVVNNLPGSVEELRAIVGGWRRLFTTEVLLKILQIVKEEVKR